MDNLQGSPDEPIEILKRTTRKKQKTSWVWEYFDLEIRDGEQWAICKLKEMGTDIPCKKTYKTGGSTKNCIEHLSNKHNIFPDGRENKSQQVTGARVAKKHKESRQLELRQYLVDFIIDTAQPLRIVERVSFRRLIYELDSAFTMPDSKGVRAIIHCAYNYTFNAMVGSLQPITSVSLTLDLWTARSNNGYLGITCSYVDQQYKLHEIVLTLSYVRYPHTAENIKDAIEEILDSWNLRSKVHSITTDNGSNVKKCVKSMDGIEWHPCASHTLQLIIGKGLIPVKKLILRVKRLINFFSRPKQAERLENIQRSMGEEREGEEIKKTDKYLRTIQDCETRWNSSYHAWQRLLLLRDAISLLNTRLAREASIESKKDSKQLKEIMITTQEWDLVQSLVDVLEPFAEATDYLGGSSYCTYSVINPIIEEIKRRLKKSSSRSSSPPLSPDTNRGLEDDDAFDFDDGEDDANPHQINTPVNPFGLLNAVKEKLYENLCQYWNFQDPNILLATLLDPRTKSLKDVPVRIQLQTEDLLREKVEELKLESCDSPLQSLIPSDFTQTSSPRLKRIRYKNSVFTKFHKSQPKAVNDEALEYFKLDEIDWEENPFAWWAYNEKRFPHLSILARKYLSVPAASTASERMFSDAGNLMGPKRTRMSPELFKRIIFLKRNYEILPSIHPPKQ